MSAPKIFRYICLFFLTGIFFGSFLSTFKNGWWLFLLSGSILVVASLPNKLSKKSAGENLYIVGIMLIFFALGCGRLIWFQSNFSQINQVPFQREIVLLGEVTKEPEVNINNQKVEFTAEKIYTTEGFLPISGKVLLTTDRFLDLKYGDAIRVSGRLKEPPVLGTFSYKDYLAMRGIGAVSYFPDISFEARNKDEILTPLFELRNKFQQQINLIFPEPQASLLSGLILGAKKNMDKTLMDNFSRTGTTHIIALSGYNITIVAIIFMAVLLACGLYRPQAFYFAVLGIVFFVLITGASTSVVRAAIMGILMLVAQKFGRLSLAANSVIFAGAVMALVNPAIVRYDVGFQLSFLATLSLIYIAPWVDEKLKWLPDLFYFKEILVATLAVEIMVLPILLYNFGQISLVAPLVNILVLPLVPIAMLVGFIAVLASFIWLPIGQVLAWAGWLILQCQISIVELFGALKFSALKVVTVYSFWLWVYYVALFIVIWRSFVVKKSSIKA
ncbi:MAG: hypothetical protein COU81_02430 [Candidatus Portnoybacteria bacterium CG10_big_fil_rev_8_21_14_0_10_36_7]|uniref:ComEC/Rec2-related protein domain-containing protein n=1 Tax=Candidatus Portnoybacteria bacterium CG10_big_fil_rev_8_21_14_0_10_36_7 TaxID=1974812 RepID=A0A2M8KDZ6_9BACT|nr:MAG: hypothetical protein COU81_02430 [Candidatus Portnoybacteria bacterium CG10_big_fil_rev_8_21_14_0_10_36_7]